MKVYLSAYDDGYSLVVERDNGDREQIPFNASHASDIIHIVNDVYNDGMTAGKLAASNEDGFAIMEGANV